jgi:hypothetical protein
MAWLSIIWTAVKAFLSGLTAARKAKAAAELSQGADEVKHADANVAAVEAELKP